MSFNLISTAYADVATGAAGQHSQQGGFLQLIIILGLFFLVSYFIIWRPQSKRAKEHRELLSKLGKGDEVITNSGIVGRISKIADGDNIVMLEIADNVEIRIQKAAIATVLPKGTMKSV